MDRHNAKADTAAPRSKVRSMAYIAVCAVLMAVCSWISVPTVPPFTMQTFAVFAAAGLLRDWRGAAAVLVYIAMGAAGLPVFAGFTGGLGVLAGPTGGFIAGFVLSAAVYRLITMLCGTRTLTLILAMTAGLALCYACGTAWFLMEYPGNLASALTACVLPFVLPDAVKIALAVVAVKKLGRFVKA